MLESCDPLEEAAVIVTSGLDPDFTMWLMRFVGLMVTVFILKRVFD